MEKKMTTDVNVGSNENNKKTILVIEDNELNMKLVRNLLKLKNFKVIESEDAEQGMEMAETYKPDLILMDINLPGIDGLTATKKIKENEALKHIPIVALTSYAMQGDEEKSINAGCAGYISKPIDTKTFVETLSQHLH